MISNIIETRRGPALAGKPPDGLLQPPTNGWSHPDKSSQLGQNLLQPREILRLSAIANPYSVDRGLEVAESWFQLNHVNIEQKLSGYRTEQEQVDHVSSLALYLVLTNPSFQFFFLGQDLFQNHPDIAKAFASGLQNDGSFNQYAPEDIVRQAYDAGRNAIKLIRKLYSHWVEVLGLQIRDLKIDKLAPDLIQTLERKALEKQAAREEGADERIMAEEPSSLAAPITPAATPALTEVKSIQAEPLIDKSPLGENDPQLLEEMLQILVQEVGDKTINLEECLRLAARFVLLHERSPFTQVPEDSDVMVGYHLELSSLKIHKRKSPGYDKRKIALGRNKAKHVLKIIKELTGELARTLADNNQLERERPNLKLKTEITLFFASVRKEFSTIIDEIRGKKFEGTVITRPLVKTISGTDETPIPPENQ